MSNYSIKVLLPFGSSGQVPPRRFVAIIKVSGPSMIISHLFHFITSETRKLHPRLFLHLSLSVGNTLLCI